MDGLRTLGLALKQLTGSSAVPAASRAALADVDRQVGRIRVVEDAATGLAGAAFDMPVKVAQVSGRRGKGGERGAEAGVSGGSTKGALMVVLQTAGGLPAKGWHACRHHSCFTCDWTGPSFPCRGAVDLTHR